MLRAKGEEAGALVLVSGERGVGKTRLVHEFAVEARTAGWSVATGQARELESQRPYAAIDAALRPLLRGLDPDVLAACTRGLTTELAPILSALPRSPSGTDTTTGDDVRSRMFWHFTQFLQRLARQQPLLITLDDLHWAVSRPAAPVRA